MKAGIVIFFSTLNEKQRRLYAGLESLKLGREGDKVISDLLDINIKTVSKGKRELLENAVHVDTIRSSGGGRKKKEESIPDLISRIEKLMEYEPAREGGEFWSFQIQFSIIGSTETSSVEA